MRSRALILIIVATMNLLSISVWPLSAGAAVSGSPVTAVLTSSAATVHIGSPIVLTVTIMNNGTTAVVLHSPGFGLYAHFRVVSQATGLEVAEAPVIEERVADRYKLRDVILRPGASWQTTFDLSHFVQIVDPGTYNVSIVLEHTAHIGDVSTPSVHFSTNVISVTAT